MGTGTAHPTSVLGVKTPVLERPRHDKAASQKTAAGQLVRLNLRDSPYRKCR
jgi:hypothetical protein